MKVFLPAIAIASMMTLAAHAAPGRTFRLSGWKCSSARPPHVGVKIVYRGTVSMKGPTWAQSKLVTSALVDVCLGLTCQDIIRAQPGLVDSFSADGWSWLNLPFGSSPSGPSNANYLSLAAPEATGGFFGTNKVEGSLSLEGRAGPIAMNCTPQR